jgi:hypothetical protein
MIPESGYRFSEQVAPKRRKARGQKKKAAGAAFQSRLVVRDYTSSTATILSVRGSTTMISSAWTKYM